jgi:hypothetical protein
MRTFWLAYEIASILVTYLTDRAETDGADGVVHSGGGRFGFFRVRQSTLKPPVRAAAAFAPKRRHHRPYAQEAEGAVQISGKCESCGILAPSRPDGARSGRLFAQTVKFIVALAHSRSLTLDFSAT